VNTTARAGLVVWTAVLCTAPLCAMQAPFTRINLTPSGAQSAGQLDAPSISADGRYIAYSSTAADLVPGDTNGVQDVFVQDRSSGLTERISVADLSAVQGNARSFRASISADGRYVAFTSAATNLTAHADTNGVLDIYVRDRHAGRTRLISVVAAGHAAAGDAASGLSHNPTLSGDGQWLVYYSEAHDLLAPGVDTNGYDDAYLVELSTNTHQLLSVSAAGAAADWHSGTMGPEDPAANAISDDGRFVVFSSAASNLVPGVNSGLATLYWRDRVTGSIQVVARTPTGAHSLHASSYPAISGDGSIIAYFSDDPSLVPDDGDTLFNFFATERITGATQRVDMTSASTPCAPSSGASFGMTGRVSVSRDGRLVALSCDCSNSAPGDTNNQRDIYLHDRSTRATHLISRALTSQSGNGLSTRAALSADGAWLAFQSAASNLIVGDTNGAHDIYCTSTPWSASTFCTGDGSAAPCPCGNQGGPGRGCGHSGNAQGVRLAASGMPSIAWDSVSLLAAGLPAGAPTLLLQSTNAASAILSFGDGLRCLGSPVVRMGLRSASAQGTVDRGCGVSGDARLSAVGQVPLTGGTRYYQLYYRNAGSFCAPEQWNTSNGLSLEWRP